MRRFTRVIAAIAIIQSLATPLYAGAVFDLTSQARSVTARAQAGADVQPDDQKTSDQTGTFNATVNATAEQGVTSFGELFSFIDPSSFSMTGTNTIAFTGVAPDNIAESLAGMDVSFNVTAPTPYRAEFTATNQGDALNFAAIQLRNVNAPGTGDFDLAEGDQRTGTLDAGAYSFHADIRVSNRSTTNDGGNATYNYSLSFGVDAGQPPPAIPLPPAIYAGAVVLAWIVRRAV